MLNIIPIKNIPDIHPGDNLADIIDEQITAEVGGLENGDVIIITQKIISKAENRYVNLENIHPSRKARKLSRITNKSPELIELILQQSRKVIRCNKRSLIVEHKLGFICANAGIDHSNVGRDKGKAANWYLLLPEDPDRSAAEIRTKFENKYGIEIGVLVIDSHGRAWRYGTVGTMIGISGMPALVDLRGEEDLYGYKLKITRVGAADELAGAASLVMGQSHENIPVVIARGFPYPLRESRLKEILRPERKDLFR